MRRKDKWLAADITLVIEPYIWSPEYDHIWRNFELRSNREVHECNRLARELQAHTSGCVTVVESYLAEYSPSPQEFILLFPGSDTGSAKWLYGRDAHASVDLCRRLVPMGLFLSDIQDVLETHPLGVACAVEYMEYFMWHSSGAHYVSPGCLYGRLEVAADDKLGARITARLGQYGLIESRDRRLYGLPALLCAYLAAYDEWVPAIPAKQVESDPMMLAATAG